MIVSLCVGGLEPEGGVAGGRCGILVEVGEEREDEVLQFGRYARELVVLCDAFGDEAERDGLLSGYDFL